MIRYFAIAFVLTALLALTSGCMDQDPGELSVRLMQQDKPMEGLIAVFNNKGVQVQEHHTERGFVIIPALAPGTYFLKFKDYSDPPVFYAAIRKVEISPGDSEVLDVDVDDASTNPADFPTGE